MSRGTRTRRATHAQSLAGGQRCPACRSTLVHRTQSRNGREAGDYWCGACGVFFWEDEAQTQVKDERGA